MSSEVPYSTGGLMDLRLQGFERVSRAAGPVLSE